MAYHIDSDGDIVVDVLQNGIGNDPYSGLTDVRNMNITSVPGEASAGFATQSVYAAPSYSNVTMTAIASNLFTATGIPLIEQNQAIYIVSTGTISGLTTATPYYMSSVSTGGGTTTFSLTTQYIQSAGTGISTGTSGAATFSTYAMTLAPRGSIRKNYTAISVDASASGGPTHWVADSNGLVWSDKVTTTGSNGGSGVTQTSSWTYTGNVGAVGPSADPSAAGNGFVYLQTVNSSGGLDGWLFLWRQGQIDYLKVMTGNTAIASELLSWKYAWKASLETSILYANTYGPMPHEAVITPGNRVAFCDAYMMGLFYQTSTGTSFDPTNSGSYTYNGGASGFPILPVNDIAQCCSYLGTYLYIGGKLNVIYPWDLVSSQFTPPLVECSERDIKNIVNVAQNGYVFAGNRGKIYIINGSQADLWAKVPDHTSDTVQPTFQWGDASYGNNQLYFGIYEAVPGSTASVNPANAYGGVWGVDLSTRSVYLSNVLSGGGYTGYCAAVLPMGLGEYAGNGFFAGWYGSASSSGMDVSVNVPYSAGQSFFTSEMIPVGTLLKPMTPLQFEFKLSKPLVAGESVSLSAGSYLDMTYASFVAVGTATSGSFVTSTGTGTVATLSGNFPSSVQTQQWLLVRANVASTSTTPSYCRIRELRVIGDTIKTQVPSQPYSFQ